MDERTLREIFRDAPGETPEPSFTLHDVTAAARRATARRRATVALPAAAFVLLAGGGVLGVVLGGGSAEPVTALAPAHDPPPGLDAQGHGREQGGLPGSAEVSPKQGGVAGEQDGPPPVGTLGCGTVDAELAAALAAELPVAAGTRPRGTAVCAAGTRGAAFEVDGATVSAVLVPKGVEVELGTQPRGSAVARRSLPDGRTIVLISNPPPGSTVPPLAGDLDRIAAALADVVRG